MTNVLPIHTDLGCDPQVAHRVVTLNNLGDMARFSATNVTKSFLLHAPAESFEKPMSLVRFSGEAVLVLERVKLPNLLKS